MPGVRHWPSRLVCSAAVSPGGVGTRLRPIHEMPGRYRWRPHWTTGNHWLAEGALRRRTGWCGALVLRHARLPPPLRGRYRRRLPPSPAPLLWTRDLLSGEDRAERRTPEGRWRCRVVPTGSWEAMRSGLDIAGGGGSAPGRLWGRRAAEWSLSYALAHEGRLPTGRIPWPRGRVPRRWL